MKKLFYLLLIPFLTGCIEVQVNGFLNSSEDFYLVSSGGEERDISSGEFSLYGKFNDSKKNGYFDLKVNKLKFKFPFKLDEGETFEQNFINLTVTADESGQPFDFQFSYKYHEVDQYGGSEHKACTYNCGTSNDPKICYGYQWIRYTVYVYEETSSGQFTDGDIEPADFSTSRRYHRRYDDHTGNCR